MRLNRISIIFIFKKRISARTLSLSLVLSFLFSLLLPRIHIHKIIIVNDVGECKATGVAFLFSAGGSNCLVLCAPSNSASTLAREREKAANRFQPARHRVDRSYNTRASPSSITFSCFVNRCPLYNPSNR